MPPALPPLRTKNWPRALLEAAGLASAFLFIALWLIPPENLKWKGRHPPPLPSLAPGVREASFPLLESVRPDSQHRPIYPPAVFALDRVHVAIDGFMSPFDSLTDLRSFLLLGFPTGCNFCAPPSLNQVVFVRRPERDTPYPFVDGPVRVTGTLHLWREDSTDPAHQQDFLFVLDQATVEVLPAQGFRKQDHRVAVP